MKEQRVEKLTLESAIERCVVFLQRMGEGAEFQCNRTDGKMHVLAKDSGTATSITFEIIKMPKDQELVWIKSECDDPKVIRVSSGEATEGGILLHYQGGKTKGETCAAFSWMAYDGSCQSDNWED